MKKTILFCFLLLSICAKAQTKKDSIDISDLYTPSSPGFVLMDVAPTSVEKPTVTKAFEADVLNLVQGAAIQVTPFWLKNHDNLRAEDYAKHITPLYQTFNLSVATVRTDSNYTISLGVRTQFLRVFAKKSQVAVKKEISVIQTKEGDLADAIMNGDTARIKQDTTTINRELKKYTKLITRPVFVIEFAGAILGATPSSPYSKSTLNTLSKSGAWLNFRYSPPKLPLNFVGVARYTLSGEQPKESRKDSAFVDTGFGIFYANNKINLSGEWINRYDVSAKDNYERVAFSVNYKINNQIIIVGSFGKNFNNVGNVFTALGINFGISKSTVQVADPPQ